MRAGAKGEEHLKPNQNKIQAVQICFEEYLKTKEVRSGSYPIFDILEKAEIYKPSKENKIKAILKAQKFLVEQEKRKPIKEQKLFKFSDKSALCIVYQAKAFLLQDFFLFINEKNVSHLFKNSK